MDSHADAHRRDLVEPEGVNAGSDHVVQEHPEGDVVSGGRPDLAPDPEDDSADAAQDAQRPEPTSEQDERRPSEPHGSSGQDAGLME